MNKKAILITLYPGCISYEVALAAELLSERYQILTATPDGMDLANSCGLPLKAHLSFAQADLAGCRAVLVPGGDPKSVIDDRDIDRVLNEAHARGLLIGAICAGPSLLGKAGILKGRRIAHGYGPEQLVFLKEIFRDSIVTDELFVADGNILTAKPQAHIEFAVEIACRLGVIAAPRADRLKEYYRGTIPTEVEKEDEVRDGSKIRLWHRRR